MAGEAPNDRAYANGAFIEGAAAYPDRWDAAAAAFRAAQGARARLDLPYGPHPRQRYDLFLPGGAPRGLAVFVHGGYWLSFGRESWSHLAAGPLARGWAVALPSYRQAPEVGISEITGDIARMLRQAAAEVAGPLLLAGHSAGGHLVARMLCADAGLPGAVADRIAHVLPISPLGDLRPLIDTTMNAALGLDAEEARRESPALHPAPAGAPVTVWVGAEERPAFLDQAAGLARAWDAALRIAPGRHHFDVIEDLASPDAPLTAALVAPVPA